MAQNDVRYLTELAFKTVISGLTSGFQLLVSGDMTPHVHPTILCMVTSNQEDIAPGTGIFRQRVNIDLVTKADTVGSGSAAGLLVQSVRQCFYRNDLSSRGAMQDLALRLGAAITTPGLAYTCLGIVQGDDRPVQSDAETRNYTYRFAFNIRATPTK